MVGTKIVSQTMHNVIVTSFSLMLETFLNLNSLEENPIGEKACTS